VRAVDDVSFAIARGEVAALLGPNGSGKSTLMRCLIGFFSPTGGRVRVGGVDVAERPVAARREVGYLPEQVTLYPDLGVRRYLRFVAGMKGLDRRSARRAVETVIASCGLETVAERLTGKLSKGFRQRVGVAQALLGDPPVLVLDEPTVGLDPVLRRDLWELFHELARAGATLLVSSHVMDEADRCDSLLLIREGRLLAQATPDELRAQTGEQLLDDAFLHLIEGSA
jgi:ABC-2 type transport system ATP-binding protein